MIAIDEQMIERLEAHEAALERLVDQLFAAGARHSGMLVSQASATVGSLAQEIRAAHSLMAAKVAELIEEKIVMHRRTMNDAKNEPALRYMASGAFEALRELRAALVPHPEGTDQ